MGATGLANPLMAGLGGLGGMMGPGGINPLMNMSTSQTFITPTSVVVLKNMVTQDEVNDDAGTGTALLALLICCCGSEGIFQ